MTAAALEAVLRRDRIIVLAALGALVAIAWAYVAWLADDMRMGGMDMTGFRMIPAARGLMMPAATPWVPLEFMFVFAMWAVMMVGMMTPSAAPMILLYARVGRQATAENAPFAPSFGFTTGYLLIWCLFALAATLAQWGLYRVLLLTPMMESANSTFGGIVLIAAGLFHWTPLTDTCLRQCQAPWLFLQRHGGFRRDAAGSLALGARHGVYCVGCCWALMALLFVVGVMNVLWIAILTILILAERSSRPAASSHGSRVPGLSWPAPGCSRQRCNEAMQLGRPDRRSPVVSGNSEPLPGTAAPRDPVREDVILHRQGDEPRTWHSHDPLFG